MFSLTAGNVSGFCLVSSRFVKLFRVIYSIIYYTSTTESFRKYTVLLQWKTWSNSSTSNNRHIDL